MMSSISNVNDKNYTDNESDHDEYMTFRLELGDTFEDWDLAVRQVERRAMEVGFEVAKRPLS